MKIIPTLTLAAILLTGFASPASADKPLVKRFCTGFYHQGHKGGPDWVGKDCLTYSLKIIEQIEKTCVSGHACQIAAAGVQRKFPAGSFFEIREVLQIVDLRSDSEKGCYEPHEPEDHIELKKMGCPLSPLK